VLIVITGPIASGKSTIARATATELTRRGESVAVIDIDVLYDMLDHRPGAAKSDEPAWRIARASAATLADTFFQSGINTVILEGRFFRPERAAFLAALRTPESPRFVTLRVSYREALRRAEGDATRGVSRDPAFLAPYFRRTLRDLDALPDTDIVIDTEREPVDDSVAILLHG
jgi:predicted kinase